MDWSLVTNASAHEAKIGPFRSLFGGRADVSPPNDQPNREP